MPPTKRRSHGGGDPKAKVQNTKAAGPIQEQAEKYPHIKKMTTWRLGLNGGFRDCCHKYMGFAIHVLLMRCILIVSTHFRIGVSIAQAARESPGAWDLG